MDKIRLGIVGLGNMGSIHLSYLLKGDVIGATATAICDIDKTALDKFAASSKLPAFAKYQELLDSKTVDAIIIATPHYSHTEIAAAAFAKGIHVLCEKPIAVTVKAAREINELWTKNYQRLKFGIMFQQRTSPVYGKVRELIAGGELGEITRVTWMCTDWFRSWAYYASGGWRATWEGEGGGVLINQCPHTLDMMYWITGMIPRRVTAVARLGHTHPIEVEDEVSAIMEYPNGAIGHFMASTGEAPGTGRAEIAGDHGKITIEQGRTVRFGRTRQSVKEFNRTTPESFSTCETWDFEVPVKTVKDGHAIITQNFVNAVLKDEKLIAPAIEGIKGLETGNAMLMAGITGTPVELPMDGDAYEAFLKGLIRKYRGKKTLMTKATTANMEASYKR